MAQLINPSNLTRHTGVTTETVLDNTPCIVFALLPNTTTTGTITLRDGNVADASGAIKHVAATGLTPAGVQFGSAGVRFNTGLTIQLSAGTDVVGVVWAPI